MTRKAGESSVVAIDEARLRAIVDTAEDGIIAINEDGIIEVINRSAEELFGYSAMELLGKHVDTICPCPKATQIYLRPVESQGADKNGTRLTREVEGRRKDGTTFPLRCTANKVRLDSNNASCIFVRDLTRERNLEEQLRQAQKMEAVGTLASGVAHDFNNLLMGVGGCANIALDLLDETHPVRAYLEEIRNSANSGAEITKQLLAFSTRRETAPTVLDLNALVTDGDAMLRHVLREDIDLVIALGATNAYIRADPAQMEQVLMNLCINARDAMPQGGQLRIETREIKPDESIDPALDRSGEVCIALTVSDTGDGMSEETRSRVFEPFFTTKEKGKGTGLGLATVYGVVQQAGGHITVQSRKGEGTTFEILLPQTERAATADVRESESGVESSGETILLVEDERLVRMATRHYLEQCGYHVLEASSGLEAIEKCRGHTGSIDLLLTDMVLPAMGGVQVAAAIKGLRPEAAVLYMSAHSDEWLAEQKRLEKGTPVLQKPFEKDVLRASVRAALDRAVCPES